RIRCRQCNRQWGLSDSEAGRLWRCPACKQEAVLPGEKIASSPRPSPADRKTVPGRHVSAAPEGAQPPPSVPATFAAPASAPLPPAAMADSNIAMIDSSAAIETEYSGAVSGRGAMSDDDPVIEMVSEIKIPARHADEKPYEIRDSD